MGGLALISGRKIYTKMEQDIFLGGGEEDMVILIPPVWPEISA